MWLASSHTTDRCRVLETSLGLFFKWSFYFLLLSFVFISIWLHWVFTAVRGLSPVVASRGYSVLQCAGFCCRGVSRHRSSSCGPWVFSGSAPRNSSQTREWTCVPCTGRQILNHWTPGEALETTLLVPILFLAVILHRAPHLLWTPRGDFPCSSGLNHSHLVNEHLLIHFPILIYPFYVFPAPYSITHLVDSPKDEGEVKHFIQKNICWVPTTRQTPF